MKIHISSYESQSRYAKAFLATTVRLLTTTATYELLFCDLRWHAVQKVAIALDLDEENLMVGIAGLAPALGFARPYPSVAAIWVSPMVRRQGVGLALLRELSRIAQGKPLEVDMLSSQVTFLCKKANAQGIRIRYADTSGAWMTMD